MADFNYQSNNNFINQTSSEQYATAIPVPVTKKIKKIFLLESVLS